MNINRTKQSKNIIIGDQAGRDIIQQHNYFNIQNNHHKTINATNTSLSNTVNNNQEIKPFNIPIPRNPFFTGRNDILLQLHNLLNRKTKLVIKSSQNSTALSGLGGIGKTQTAIEYAYRYKDSYCAVLWVLADGKMLLQNNFAELSQLLGFKVKRQDDQILAVQKWLRDNQNWLLIFDNAETLELLTAAKELLPVDIKGHILFTTRAQATGNIASINIDCFDIDTGTMFLLRRSKTVLNELSTIKAVFSNVSNQNLKFAKDIVQELGGLALAIDQAGAYIEQTDCGLEGYLIRYRSNSVKMLKERGFVHSNDHPDAVYKTFLLALEQVQKRHNLTSQILRDCVFLHPDGIPEKFYSDCDPLELDIALSTLKDYSLIKRVIEKKIFTVHRLVQIVIKDVYNE